MSGDGGRTRVASRRLTVFKVIALSVLVAALVASLFPLPDAARALWSAAVLEARALHHGLHHQLSSAVRALRAEGATAAWGLVTLSFLYGVFHAAGPGHGKVVISTYLLTHESQLRRGLVLSVVSSLCQGATAIVAVTTVVGLLGFTLRQAEGATTGLESLSYGLVALVGVMLVATRLGRVWRRRGASSTFGRNDEPARPRTGHDAEPHVAACSTCGHRHGPSSHDLDAPLSWHGIVGIVASIGLRPCTGAVLVLLVAYSIGLRWAGIGAVLAMSLGTALTVSLLAALSVYARQTALRLTALMPDHRAGRLSIALDVVAVLGGLVLMVAGIVMLQAASGAPANLHW